ncbi:2-polyprenyl-6-methoxyphenol hydroxylase-like FAD-dependent oxidoreductase [Nonomuraea polychroma]|uniref:2-polyprenyl-6-methoxyphenol hydroxylase-like FAD-dependent oxidoreductase n=1 Tax=Nonomuraea polychroma TaxID=46176 RepID=A0A438MG57_9ACTN|nr:FAD-dependent monooxygenase [Nonomuraea polychroma]RVX44819.1 2-polyprenyl-6-methoxyphenol hydroxylase-like FAD-dependent oxidoreductase [Nonomuraea polychroma]
MRIVVVGAGLGGVAAAVGLHRLGHEVTLFERGAELREAGTGIVVMPNGLRALDALGLAEDVRGHVMHATRGGLRDWRGRPLLVTDLVEAQQEVGTPAMIDRPELHRALRTPLPSHLVRTATPVERLEPDPTGVTVISDGNPVARADAVIAADGIGSKLREQLFPGHPGLRRTGRMDLRGMLPRPPGVATDLLASQLVDRRSGAMFGLFPVGEDRLYWFTDSDLHGTPPGPEEARRQMLSLMADWHPLVPALIEATPPADIYVDPISRLAEPLPSFAAGRIALLGDAAHAMSPDLGQGASQAFEDAAALSRHLIGAEPADIVQRLLRYDAERRPSANRMMRAAARQSRLTSQTGIAAWLRDTLLRAIPSRLATRQLAALWRA